MQKMEAANVYTQDGTVDLQGRPVLASKTGRWRACSFLLGILASYIKKHINWFCFINSQAIYSLVCVCEKGMKRLSGWRFME